MSRMDTIVGFGETRIHAESATLEPRASEVASPRLDDQLTIGGETFVLQENQSGMIRASLSGASMRDRREVVR